MKNEKRYKIHGRFRYASDWHGVHVTLLKTVAATIQKEVHCKGLVVVFEDYDLFMVDIFDFKFRNRGANF